jgi:hypothetical protein
MLPAGGAGGRAPSSAPLNRTPRFEAATVGPTPVTGMVPADLGAGVLGLEPVPRPLAFQVQHTSTKTVARAAAIVLRPVEPVGTLIDASAQVSASGNWTRRRSGILPERGFAGLLRARLR